MIGVFAVLSKVGWATVATTVVSILVKFGWRAVQHDRQMLAAIHAELTLQRTNCLATIQAQGARHIELLEKINENQIEQTGYIKGYAASGRRQD